jgi:hypothetical protein
VKEHWKSEPDEHDYPAAEAYLSLVLEPALVDRTVAALRRASLSFGKGKDLLRASRLDLLGEDNPHVAADLGRVRAGKRLSPVLLVRGDLGRGVPLTIADGYHRVCASYHIDENALIPFKLVSVPAPRRASS